MAAMFLTATACAENKTETETAQTVVTDVVTTTALEETPVETSSTSSDTTVRGDEIPDWYEEKKETTFTVSEPVIDERFCLDEEYSLCCSEGRLVNKVDWSNAEVLSYTANEIHCVIDSHDIQAFIASGTIEDYYSTSIKQNMHETKASCSEGRYHDYDLGKREYKVYSLSYLPIGAKIEIDKPSQEHVSYYFLCQINESEVYIVKIEAAEPNEWKLPGEVTHSGILYFDIIPYEQ